MKTNHVSFEIFIWLPIAYSCFRLCEIQRCWFVSFLHLFDYFLTSVKPFVTKSNNCWLTPLLMENATYFLPRNVWQHNWIFERKKISSGGKHRGSHKMKVRFVCCSLQVFDEVVSACCIMSQDSWAKRSVLNIFVWTYFQLVFCCNKWLTTIFSNFIREYLPLRPYQALIDFDKSSYILHYD